MFDRSYGPHELVAYDHLPEIGVKYVEIDSLTSEKHVKVLKTELEDVEGKFAVGSFFVSVDIDL